MSHTGRPVTIMRTKGFEIEQYVAEYLQKQGIEIITRNFSCKMGEIDIICKDKPNTYSEVLVFIEVRYRKNTLYGSAAESVTHTKQQKLIRTAHYYLMKNPWEQHLDCRFDVIAVSLEHNLSKIEWIQDAFQS